MNIQFTDKDIAEKFLEIYELEGQMQNNALTAIAHELKSNLSSARSNLHSASTKMDPNYSSEKERFMQRYGPELNFMQELYVENMEGKIMLTMDEINKLDDACLQKGAFSKKSIERTSKTIIDHLQRIVFYSPIAQNVLDFGKLSEWREQSIRVADYCIESAIYLYNRKFSADFRTEIYSLENDVKNYWVEGFNKNDKNRILLNKPNVDDIKTHQDYFTNVILPILQNIQEHATDPSNDIFHRLNTKDSPFNHGIDISSQVNEDKKNVEYTITDHGFGMKPDILDNIFDKGFSTKKDQTMDHGIGLWGVRYFLSDNHGDIWCESELGRFTRFHFTIPYDRKEIDSYIKD